MRRKATLRLHDDDDMSAINLGFELKRDLIKRYMRETKKQIEKIVSNASELDLFRAESGIEEPFAEVIEDLAELKRLNEAKYRRFREQLKLYGGEERMKKDLEGEENGEK